MLKRDIIEDLAILLEAFLRHRMISSLGRLGVLEKMGSATSFRLNDFPDIPNSKLLQDSFDIFSGSV